MFEETLPLELSSPNLDGNGLHIGIVVARYNWQITGTMLQLARTEFARLGVAREAIQVISVPGAYELATGAATLLKSDTFDATLCIGCVMKGATRHDVVVSDAAAQGIQRVALDTGIPVIFGVICAENLQQAQERVERGIECAQATVEMAQLRRTLGQQQPSYR